MYRLVKIEHNEYCALFDAGAWVQSDTRHSRNWDAYEHPLKRSTDDQRFPFYPEWTYYTRVKEEEEEA